MKLCFPNTYRHYSHSPIKLHSPILLPVIGAVYKLPSWPQMDYTTTTTTTITRPRRLKDKKDNDRLIVLPVIGTSPSKQSWPHMNYTTADTAAAATAITRRHRRKDNKDKERVIVIMGATGTGKSRLSIDLATRFFPSSEIINSDKMQVYNGLDITTNKIPFHERLGVPHHLLGEINSAEFTPSEFRSAASSVISDIISRRKLPIIAGGSNSFIHALLSDKYDPDSDSDPFNESNSVSSELRYDCCFLWVDVKWDVLSVYLSKRVDDMLDSGMFDELSEFYDPVEEKGLDDSITRIGIRKAIGVPEFNRYFRKYPPLTERRRLGRRTTTMFLGTNPDEDVARRECYEEAVQAIKDNTCRLAEKQIGKIVRLKEAGWNIKRLDATEAFRAVVTSDTGKRESEYYWEKEVLEPSVKIVKRFLEG